MTARAVELPPERVWLRVAQSSWDDPLDPSFAAAHGGRWNPPNSHRTLYLNGDVHTAKLQLERMLIGYPASVEDLDDAEYLLVAAKLPRNQRCADAVTHKGLEKVGLPSTYPLDAEGSQVEHAVCQRVGARLRSKGLRGVWCKSACTADGEGRELAWFPATAKSVARAIWVEGVPLGQWRSAQTWADLELPHQPDPVPAML